MADGWICDHAHRARERDRHRSTRRVRCGSTPTTSGIHTTHACDVTIAAARSRSPKAPTRGSRARGPAHTPGLPSPGCGACGVGGQHARRRGEARRARAESETSTLQVPADVKPTQHSARHDGSARPFSPEIQCTRGGIVSYVFSALRAATPDHALPRAATRRRPRKLRKSGARHTSHA